MPAITSVINVHAEGSIARATIESMLAAEDFATQRGVSVRTLIVADRATQDTIEAIGPYRDRMQIEHVNLGDLGLARNFGVDMSASEYVSFFDGDDLAGADWLYQAYVTARENPNYIVHPHYCIHFGKFEHITEIVPMTDRAFRKTYTIFANPFPPHNLARTAVHLNVRYRKIDLASGFGYEDWAWNRDTIRAGYVHVVAKDTMMFYRRKHAGSLNLMSASQGCLPLASPRFFEETQPSGTTGRAPQRVIKPVEAH